MSFKDTYRSLTSTADLPVTERGVTTPTQGAGFRDMYTKVQQEGADFAELESLQKPEPDRLGPKNGIRLPQTIDELSQGERDSRVARVARRANPDYPVWAVAAQMDEKRRKLAGNPVVGDQRLLMYDAYKRAYTGERLVRDKAEQDKGFFENFSNAALRTAAGTASSATGIVSPKFAQNLQDNINSFYGEYDSDSVGGITGEILGNIAVIAPAVFSPTGAAAFVGASAVGGERTNIRRFRQGGDDVSVATEWTSAISHGVGEFIFERVGLGVANKAAKVITKTIAPRVFKALRQGQAAAVTEAVVQGIKSLGLNAGQETMTEIWQNFTKDKLYSDTGLFEGTGRAALQGAGTSAGVTALGVAQGLTSGEDIMGEGPEVDVQPDGPEGRHVQPQEVDATELGAEEFAEAAASQSVQESLERRDPTPEMALAEAISEQVRSDMVDQEFDAVGHEARDGRPLPRTAAEFRAEILAANEGQKLTGGQEAAPAAVEAESGLPADFEPGTQQEATVGLSEEASFLPDSKAITDTISGEVAIQELPIPMQEAVSQIQKVVGKDTSVRVMEDMPGRGLFDPGTGTLYIKNTNDKGSMWEALVHEAMHSTGLDVTSQIGTPEKLSKYRAEYLKSIRAMAAKYPDNAGIQQVLETAETDSAYLDRDAVALLAGKLATDPTFAAQISRQSPGFVQQIFNAVRRVVNTITGKQKDIDTLAAEMMSQIEKNTGLSPEVVAESTPTLELAPTFLPEPAEIIQKEAPETANFGERLKSMLNDHKASPTFKITAADRQKKFWKDDTWPLVKAFNEAVSRTESQGQRVKASDNPTFLLRTLGGWSGTIEGRVKRGLRNAKGQPIRDSVSKEMLTLDWLIDPLEKTGEKQMMEELNSALSLGVAQRTIEKSEQLDRDDDISGFKKGRPEKTDRAAAEAYIKEYQKDKEGFKRADELLRRYRLFADQTLKMAVDTGYITRQAATAMKQDNQYYVNMQRLIEDGVGGTLDLPGGLDAFHRFKGSNRTIDNPLVNLLATTDRMQRAIHYNKALRSYAEMAEVTESDDLAVKVEKPTPLSVPIRINGEVTHWEMNEEIKEVLDSYNEIAPEFLSLDKIPILGELLPERFQEAGLLNIPGRLTRAGVTHAPPFIFRNVIRDTVDRAIKSDEGTLWDTFRSMTAEDLAEFEEFGGSVGRREYGPKRQDYYRQMGGHVRELSTDKNTIVGVPTRAWQGWKKFGELMENRNRLVEFNLQRQKALRAGMSEYDAGVFAAARSRELVDFAVAGSAIRSINRFMYIPFLNAAIQGLGAEAGAVTQRPLSTMARLSMYSVLPSLAAYGWAASQGEKEKEEYLQIPAWRRDFFWNFKMGDHYTSIPKPFLFGVVGSGVERLVSAANGDDNALRGYMGSLTRAAIPVDESIVAGPFQSVVENMTNHNFFFDRSIVPVWEEGIALDLRNTDGASGLGQMMSKAATAAGFEMDPRKWDNFLAGFGGTGMIAMGLSDLTSDKPGRDLASFAAKTTGIVSVPPGYSAEDVQEVQQIATRIGDSQAPELQEVKRLLRESFDTQELAVRNERVAQAREKATELRKFYEEFEGPILEFRKRKKEAADTPQERRYDSWWRRIRELRKIRMGQPHRKEFADREIRRLLQLSPSLQ